MAVRAATALRCISCVLVRENKVSFELFDLCRVTCVQYLFKTVYVGATCDGATPDTAHRTVQDTGARAWSESSLDLAHSLFFMLFLQVNEELIAARECVWCYHQIGLASVVVIVTMVLAKVKPTYSNEAKVTTCTYRICRTRHGNCARPHRVRIAQVVCLAV